jgi:hypothetical protein
MDPAAVLAESTGHLKDSDARGLMQKTVFNSLFCSNRGDFAGPGNQDVGYCIAPIVPKGGDLDLIAGRSERL